jgi:hypothetical protein
MSVFALLFCINLHLLTAAPKWGQKQLSYVHGSSGLSSKRMTLAVVPRSRVDIDSN